MPKVFRFLYLPPELRDLVYDYLHEDVTVTNGTPSERPLLFRTPLPHVRFVSHQVKREYDQRPHDIMWTTQLPI